MLDFSRYEINRTGLRLELEAGTLDKLYIVLIDVLTEFYNQEGITFIHPRGNSIRRQQERDAFKHFICGY